MFNFDPSTFEQKETLKNHPHIRIYHDAPSGSSFVLKKSCCDENYNRFFGKIKESVFLFNLDHPSFVPIQGYHIQDDNELSIYTKMQLFEGASNIREFIEDHLKANNQISEEEIVKVLYNLAWGLDYLHSKKILHQNLEPSSIIIDKGGYARILDMSLSTLIPQEQSLTPMFLESKELGHYHAPELYHSEEEKIANADLLKTDIWSLGIIILEMCLLETEIMSHIAISSIQESHLSDIFTRIEEKERYDPHLIKIVKSMLCVDITQRCTTKEILQNIRENLSQFLTLKQKKYETKSEIIKSIDGEFDHLLEEREQSHRASACFDFTKDELSSKEEEQWNILYFQQSI